MKASNQTEDSPKVSRIIKVAVVEDHTLLRESLTQALNEEDEVQVVFDASNGREFFEHLKKKKIDIALVDLDMPEMDGKEILELLSRNNSDIRVIIFSMHSNIHIVAELIQMGAKSYLKKDCSIQDMVDAIFNVHYRGNHSTGIVSEASFVKAEKNKKKEQAMIHFNFSEREMIVIKLICSGSTSDEIASRFHVTKKSIDAIRSKLFQALSAKTPADFARICIEKGLYQPIIRELEKF
jgi:two-component system invasion response regulator UvrY